MWRHLVAGVLLAPAIIMMWQDQTMPLSTISYTESGECPPESHAPCTDHTGNTDTPPKIYDFNHIVNYDQCYDGSPFEYVPELSQYGVPVWIGGTCPEWPTGRPPACVEPGEGNYYFHSFYAYPEIYPSRYESRVEAIRNMTRLSNWWIHDATVKSGGIGADLKVLCKGGIIQVTEFALKSRVPTWDITTIQRELERAGHADPKVKYLVYLDALARIPPDPYAGGHASKFHDDRPGVSNLHNGNGQEPTIAVAYGYTSYVVWLHELLHTRGAVQNSAPHSTGRGHCYDGADIMCYNDNGPRGHLYNPSYCPGNARIDCNGDDYFNVNPPPGSYLATHWNIASRVNRYLHWEDTPT